MWDERGLCYRTAMPLDEAKLVSTSSTSGRIIAAGIVIAFCYWAASVLVTLLVAVLLAYFLDPVVTFMEEWHIPRALGSLLVVLFTIAVMLLLAVFLIERADQFGADWPQYREPLHKIASTVQQKMSTFEEHVSEIGPSQVAVPGQTIVTVEPHPIRAAVIARLSSVYEIVLAATFVPFLLFFMLAAKRQVWHATMQLFPSTRRTEVKETLTDVTQVLRSYVIGTALGGLGSGHFQLDIVLGHGIGISILAGAGVRAVQPDSLPGSGFVLDSADADRPEAISHRRTVHRNFWSPNRSAPRDREPADSGAGRLARAAQRLGADRLDSFLGLAVGRRGPDLGCAHHRGHQSNLRSQRRPAAGRPLAQRVKALRPSSRSVSTILFNSFRLSAS